MSRVIALTPEWYGKLPEKRKAVWAQRLADLCEPLEEASTLRGLLEETESYTITVDEKNNPIAFKIGDLVCPTPKDEDPRATEDNPTKPGGRRKRGLRGLRVKKQTRRTQRKRRNTVRK